MVAQKWMIGYSCAKNVPKNTSQEHFTKNMENRYVIIRNLLLSLTVFELWKLSTFNEVIDESVVTFFRPQLPVVLYCVTVYKRVSQMLRCYPAFRIALLTTELCVNNTCVFVIMLLID